MIRRKEVREVKVRHKVQKGNGEGDYHTFMKKDEA